MTGDTKAEQLKRGEKDSAGCAIAGIMSRHGVRFGCEQIVRAVANMRERANGLGGGFAAYGIYPEHKDRYALHLMYEQKPARRATEERLQTHCVIHHSEPIPTRSVAAIRRPPMLHRYFVSLKPRAQGRLADLAEEDSLVQVVMEINERQQGSFVFSSGKNMGVFKGLGYPEDIADFFCLEQYRGYIWTAHGRFPTNTTGWWGGAHPFGLLDCRA